MNVDVCPGLPAYPLLGDCFRCPRRHVQTIRIGQMTAPGGPGHTSGTTPLYACRTCEVELMAMHHQAQAYPVRPYSPAGHPH
nr:hypothetical protein OH820_31615 [Streptomyces sp. NBC_00857]